MPVDSGTRVFVSLLHFLLHLLSCLVLKSVCVNFYISLALLQLQASLNEHREQLNTLWGCRSGECVRASQL